MRIGFFAPALGPQASFGMDALNGATLATEEINLAGGILGHPLTLIIKDTESQPEKTSAVVTDLINTEKVAALIGEITTDRSLVAATLAQSSGIPMITPSATGEKVLRRETISFAHVTRIPSKPPLWTNSRARST